MSRQTIIKTITLGAILASRAMGAESFKPVLPLNLNWKPISSADVTGNKPMLFDDDSQKRALNDFKSAMTRLQKKQNATDLSKDVSLIRQSALKLGLPARVTAELMAARVTGGISHTGQRISGPTGNWRAHLLAACNMAARIDETTHEQTALRSITLWRKIEPNDKTWSPAPIDIKAQKQFKFYNSVIERQALHEWSKGSTNTALKKYRNLSKAFNGTPDGGALDLRIVQLENALYLKDKQLRRWQKVLVDFSEKYQDQKALGDGQELTAQKISSQLARIHRSLIDGLIREALPLNTSEANRLKALKAIETYLSTNISEPEKERVQNLSGDIHFNAKNHKAAAGIFAALATQTTGLKSQTYWRKAIRSQTELANWTAQPPWNDTTKGNTESRRVLLGMFEKLGEAGANDWSTVAHTGLLMISTGQTSEAINYWMEKLKTSSKGPLASRAAGWLADELIRTKNWSELESLARLLDKTRTIALGSSKSYRPRDLLGLALIEHGLEALNSNDFKTAVAKLQEFSKGWASDQRHGEGLYHLALAHQGAQQYRQALLTLEDFSKRHRRNAFRKDALKKGGDWSLGLAWDDHAIYFLEAHAREFSNDAETISTLNTLADIYLGREIYDSAIRVMTTLTSRRDLDKESKSDVARRLLDTAERYASSDTALNLARRIQTSIKDNSEITALTLSVRARIYAERGDLAALNTIDKASSNLDAAQSSTAEIVSEIKFLVADVMARNQFKDEFFSLATRDPKADLEKGYALYTKITQAYKSGCLDMRTSWCGPSLHRSARVGEKFLKSYEQLAIARTLDPKIVKDFYDRKKIILETVENQVIEDDEKSLAQAKMGATNPDWTSAIMWQNGDEWSREKFTSESAEHYIQWRTR